MRHIKFNTFEDICTQFIFIGRINNHIFIISLAGISKDWKPLYSTVDPELLKELDTQSLVETLKASHKIRNEKKMTGLYEECVSQNLQMLQRMKEQLEMFNGFTKSRKGNKNSK